MTWGMRAFVMQLGGDYHRHLTALRCVYLLIDRNRAIDRRDHYRYDTL